MVHMTGLGRKVARHGTRERHMTTMTNGVAIERHGSGEPLLLIHWTGGS